MSEPIPSGVKPVLPFSVLLLTGLLAGCTSHQLAQTPVAPMHASPFQAIQVQVNFSTPAQSDYLATQLVNELAKHEVHATVMKPDATTTRIPGDNAALLQLTLTGSWTETFISHRHKPRRSLTQMRGRIPRESPRFRSEVMLRDLQSGQPVWQSEAVTAGPWYSDFNANARSLAKKLVRQLEQQGLIVKGTAPAPS